MDSQFLPRVRGPVVIFFAAILLNVGCGALSEHGSDGVGSETHFLTFGPNVQGLTAKVQQSEIRICLGGVSSPTSLWSLWEENIRSAVLQWVEPLREISQVALTADVTVHRLGESCDATVQVIPGVHASAQVGAQPLIKMASDGYFGSYNVLLHEFGHAFALSDTYQDGQSGNCRPGQPQSIMCNTSFAEPQADDVQGIRTIFRRVFPDIALSNL